MELAASYKNNFLHANIFKKKSDVASFLKAFFEKEENILKGAVTLCMNTALKSISSQIEELTCQNDITHERVYSLQ